MQNLPKFHYTESERIECRAHFFNINYSRCLFELEIGIMEMAERAEVKHRPNHKLLNPIAKRSSKSDKWIERNKKLAFAVLTMDVAIRHVFFS